MSDHDRFCPGYMQSADPCPFCLVIAKARADERVRFARWKGEATEVMREWERVWEALGSPGRLGESKAAAVLALFDGDE